MKNAGSTYRGAVVKVRAVEDRAATSPTCRRPVRNHHDREVMQAMLKENASIAGILSVVSSNAKHMLALVPSEADSSSELFGDADSVHSSFRPRSFCSSDADGIAGAKTRRGGTARTPLRTDAARLKGDLKPRGEIETTAEARRLAIRHLEKFPQQLRNSEYVAKPGHSLDRSPGFAELVSENEPDVARRWTLWSLFACARNAARSIVAAKELADLRSSRSIR